MKEIEIDKKLRLLEKEVLCTGDEIAKVKLDLKAEIDELKIDVETIKRLVKKTLSGGEEEYRKVKGSVIREINPEMGLPSAD
ncbi:MAG: hypothetical protein ABIF87_17745 [Pseudomonadota bacterium]